MKEVLEKQKCLDLRQGLAAEVKKNKKGFKLFTSDEAVYNCISLVICGGTFLRGKILWGENLIEAGRQGEISSKRLPLSLERMNFKFGRIKNFTAPMIDGKTVDLNKLEKEAFDDTPEMFSCKNSFDGRAQLNNNIAYTGRDFNAYILRNIKRAKENDRGKGQRGIRDGRPIERNVLESGEKESFKIFIQPAGRNTKEMYLQGLETMCNEEMQEKMIKKIKGLEEAKITRPGYAVEYDYLIPSQIDCSLESKAVKGMFFAGHINGTAGYEEAAAQGIIAGINAARKVKNLRSIVGGRNNGYMGMLLRDIAAGEINLQKEKP